MGLRECSGEISDQISDQMSFKSNSNIVPIRQAEFLGRFGQADQFPHDLLPCLSTLGAFELVDCIYGLNDVGFGCTEPFQIWLFKEQGIHSQSRGCRP